jgi:hypothetical protein
LGRHNENRPVPGSVRPVAVEASLGCPGPVNVDGSCREPRLDWVVVGGRIDAATYDFESCGCVGYDDSVAAMLVLLPYVRAPWVCY